MASKRALERARSLLGVPFRLQGRDPTLGVDCVGLVIHAFALQRAGVAEDYRLGTIHDEAAIGIAVERLFTRVHRGAPGNLAVMRIGPRQLHFGIVSALGLIHADLRRHRVVEGAVPEGAQIIGYFRKRRRPLAIGRDKWQRWF